jgi:hypothetical protein
MMNELQLTWSRIAAVWWLLVWRWVYYWVGIVALLYTFLRAIPLESVGIVLRVFNTLSGTLFGIFAPFICLLFAVRRMLTKRYSRSRFRLELIKKDDGAHMVEHSEPDWPSIASIWWFVAWRVAIWGQVFFFLTFAVPLVNGIDINNRDVVLALTLWSWLLMLASALLVVRSALHHRFKEFRIALLPLSEK